MSLVLSQVPPTTRLLLDHRPGPAIYLASRSLTTV